jgi:CBS domain-containing protein
MQDIRLIENFGSRQANAGEAVDWEPIVIDDVQVKHLMSVPVLTLDADSLIDDAAKIMLANKVHCIPVTSAGKVQGIVTDTDLLAAIADGRLAGA